jgi:hypothetical protein
LVRSGSEKTQQALLEAHELAFAYFGGVFRTLRYDNMSSLVKKILRGRQRVETDRIIAFRSHWGYRSEYCNPAKGNEKGGVEGELGWFRRNCLTPVPEAESLAALPRSNQTRKIRSAGVSFSRLGAERRKTASCCRKARFSSRSWLEVLNIEASAPSKLNWCRCADRRSK